MQSVALTAEILSNELPRPTIASCEHFHAAICHTITSVDPVLGRQLHDMGRHKRVTIGLLHSRDSITLLRLTFMDQDGIMYAHILLNALARKPRLRVGSIEYEIGRCDLSNSEWTGIATWADLMTDCPHSSMRFMFDSPTAITKRGEDGRRFTCLYPEPIAVFTGLARRWQALNGPPLPQDLGNFIRGGGCVESNYDLHTEQFHTSERTQKGFVGYVVYRCLKPAPQYVTALNALARFAFFSGTGYQTMRGMGVTKTSLAQ